MDFQIIRVGFVSVDVCEELLIMIKPRDKVQFLNPLVNLTQTLEVFCQAVQSCSNELGSYVNLIN